MLVLSRKASERITIGRDVVVTVLRTDRGTVKLGIDAPPEVRVVRGELEVRDEPEMLADVIERLDLMGTTGH
nr:carbon storage regulator [Gemmatimonadota bacterium]